MAGTQSFSQPQNLANPVPGVDEAEGQAIDLGALLDAQAAGVAAPEEQAQEQVPQEEAPQGEGKALDIRALLAGPEAQPEAAPEPEPFGFKERARFSFATPKEIVNDLKKRGFEARVEGSEVKFRRNKDQKFVQVDPDDFEILNDLFADMARTGFEIAAEIPFIAEGAGVGAAAAGAAGSVIPGAGTAAGVIGGGIVGAATAGAAGAVVATNAADVFAQYALGIERDPERSVLTESAVAATFGAVGGVVGRKLSQFLGRSKATKETLEKFKETKSIGEQLPDSVGLLRQDVDDMAEAGLEVGLKTTDSTEKPVRMLLTQMDSANPEIAKLGRAIKQDARFIKAETQIADNTEDALLKVLETTSELTRPGQKVPFRELTKEVGNLAEEALKKEGEVIGDAMAEAEKTFRRSGVGVSPQKPGQAVETNQALTELLGELQIKRTGDTLQFPDSAEFAERLGLDEATLQSKKFSRSLEKFVNKMFTSKGSLSPKEIKEAIDIFGPMNKVSAVKKNPQFRQFIGKLSSSLRKDRRTIVGQNLPEDAAAEFSKSMDRFSVLKEGTESVSAILDGSKMTQRAFMNKVFNKGVEGMDSFRLAKGVIQPENPQLWREMQGEFIDRLLEESTDKAGKNIDFATFAKKLNSFGPDFKKELMEGSEFSLDTLNSALRVARNAAETKIGGEAGEQLGGTGLKALTLNILRSFSNFVSTSIPARLRIFQGLTRNKELMKTLSQTNIDDFLQTLPKTERGKFRTAWDGFLKLSDPRLSRGKITIEGTRAATGAGAREAVRENPELPNQANPLLP